MMCFIKIIIGWWLVECDGEVGWVLVLYFEFVDEMVDVFNVQKFFVGRGMIVNFFLLCICVGFKLWFLIVVFCCCDYYVYS